MGQATKRVAPRIANYVSRNFEELVIKETIKAVWKAGDPWKIKKRGRPPHIPKVVAVCCILMIALNHTYDSIESHVKNNRTLKELLGTNRLPGHSVIYRGMRMLSIPYIRKVMKRMTYRVRRKGMNLGVDSTGFSLLTSSRWFDIRMKRPNSKKDNIKLHIIADVETGVVHHFTMTKWSGSDSKELERLIKYLPELGKVMADKAYSSRINCQIVFDRKGMPYIRFKDNATGRPKSYPAWKRSFQEFQDDPEEWFAIYHLRSMVESVFSSMKRRWHSFLRSRRKWMQKKELALKVLAYDMKQVLYIQRAEELGIGLWRPV
jgi:transposase